MAAFPVAADTVHVTKDTYSDERTPQASYGQATAPLLSREHRVFADFDLASLPEGVPLTKAILRIWVSAVAAPGEITVHHVLDPWDEGSLSFDSGEGIGGTGILLAVTPEDADHYLSVDVTAFLEEARDLGTFFGLALRRRTQ